MDKRAQGLSINVIIIVAIALIVLVVLIAVFTGRMGSFVKGVDTTATCESSCSAFGMSFSQQAKDQCTAGERERFVPGNYGDIIDKTKGCCCTPTP